jgi:hypothetical protein
MYGPITATTRSPDEGNIQFFLMVSINIIYKFIYRQCDSETTSSHRFYQPYPITYRCVNFIGLTLLYRCQFYRPYLTTRIEMCQFYLPCPIIQMCQFYRPCPIIQMCQFHRPHPIINICVKYIRRRVFLFSATQAS